MILWSDCLVLTKSSLVRIIARPSTIDRFKQVFDMDSRRFPRSFEWTAPGEHRAKRRAFVAVSIIYLVFSGLSLGLFALWIGFSYLLYCILETRIQGDCARLGPQQMPEVFFLMQDLARDMKVPMPDLYITEDDDPLPVYTISLARPTLVVHSDYARKLNTDELKFFIAHELAHVKAGHLRVLSVLNVLEAHPPVSRWLTTPLELVRWAFRPWALKADETADRMALAAVGADLDIASAVLAKVAAGVEIGNRINPSAFRELARELKTGWMVWVNEMLYNRNLTARRLQLLEQLQPQLIVSLDEPEKPGRLERIRQHLLPARAASS